MYRTGVELTSRPFKTELPPGEVSARRKTATWRVRRVRRLWGYTHDDVYSQVFRARVVSLASVTRRTLQWPWPELSKLPELEPATAAALKFTAESRQTTPGWSLADDYLAVRLFRVRNNQVAYFLFCQYLTAGLLTPGQLGLGCVERNQRH